LVSMPCALSFASSSELRVSLVPALLLGHVAL
jgi:hypothetical protein